ncbi:MAG: hypothetical protein JXR49_17800 [Acidobacteria bacterium]|nr:hypothetical protein [Acidobacteriota bacterium]
MKTVAVVTCIIFQLLLVSFCISQDETKSCRNHPMVTGECFLFWGRMQLYEESPRVRIWRVGTTRVLGVMDDEYQLEGYENVPSDLIGRIDWNTAMFGDFTVCPFADDIPHRMRPICVEKAENTVIKKRRDAPQNANRLVDYAPAVVTLTGTLTKEKIPGSSDDDSAETQEVGIFLTLEEPIDIRHGDAVNVAETGIERLQLVLFAEHLERLEAFLRRKVIATGTLFHAHSEDQPARVTLIVEKLVDPEPRLVTNDIMTEP